MSPGRSLVWNHTTDLESRAWSSPRTAAGTLGATEVRGPGGIPYPDWGLGLLFRTLGPLLNLGCPDTPAFCSGVKDSVCRLHPVAFPVCATPSQPPDTERAGRTTSTSFLLYFCARPDSAGNLPSAAKQPGCSGSVPAGAHQSKMVLTHPGRCPRLQGGAINPGWHPAEVTGAGPLPFRRPDVVFQHSVPSRWSCRCSMSSLRKVSPFLSLLEDLRSIFPAISLRRWPFSHSLTLASTCEMMPLMRFRAWVRSLWSSESAATHSRISAFLGLRPRTRWRRTGYGVEEVCPEATAQRTLENHLPTRIS